MEDVKKQHLTGSKSSVWSREGGETKRVGCWPSPGCHDKCGLLVRVEGGRMVGVKGNPDHPISQGCSDRLPHLIKWQYHPDQLMYPLKRAGERGENNWERISWDQALDEIADELKRLKHQYGAETLALTEGTYRSDMYGIRSRFLNLFGNPGNIGCAGTVCMCNRAAMGFALMGAPIVNPNFSLASCVVISGWNVTSSRPVEWRNIQKPDRNGRKKKIIVIDPRQTEAAKAADIWLQLRPGTDTALFLGWLNVIIGEKLYDDAFVSEWTFGFDQLKERVSDCTPERVSEITWVPAEKIREAARMYATNRPATLNYGMATDAMGLNGMRAEQARVCLRAITGNMSVHGLEAVTGPGPIINGKIAVRDAMLQLEEKCSPEQRRKQLGADRFKLMTWTAYEITSKYYKEVYGIPQCMSGHNFLAHQPTVWQAILEGKPYPVKAMVTWTSNPLLNAANAKRVYEALKSPNLELHVVLESFMTPTALLADYVLPSASKFEQPLCSTFEDFGPILSCGQRAIKPMGERGPITSSSMTLPKDWVLVSIFRGGRMRNWQNTDLRPLGCPLTRPPGKGIL